MCWIAGVNRMWTWIGKNDKQLKIIFSLIAAIYVIYEYRTSLWTDRVERTVEFVQKYNEGEILDSNMYRTHFFIKNEEKIQKFVDDGGKTSEFILDAIKTDMIYLESVLITFDFFRGVAICGNIGLCEIEKACSYFALDMWKFKFNYQVYFDEYKREWKQNPLLEIDKFLENEFCSLKKVAK